MKSKQEKIKDYLIENGSITSWDAIMNFKYTRLSSVINRLRNKGYNIVSE